jgi:MFS family permease
MSSAPAAPLTAGAEWRRYWPLVAATAAGMSLASLITTSMGVMLGPLEQEFGWTRAQISSGPFIIAIFSLLLSAPAGYAIDRFGARRIGILVVLTQCACVALLSTVTADLRSWWAVWTLFALAATATSTVWMLPVSTCFTAARGMAIALTISGTGVTAALAPLIAEYVLEHHGWRAAFLALAVIWGTVTLPLVLKFVPAQSGAAGKSPADAHDAPPRELKGLTPGQGLRSPAFYTLLFAALCGTLAGVALLMNLVPILISTGLSRPDAVKVAGMIGLASIVGRIGGGWLMDRISVRAIAIVAALGSVIFPLSLLISPGVFSVAALTVVFHGLIGGVKINAIVYLTGTHMGMRSFGLFYGAMSMAISIAAGLGPMLANHVYDVTRSYEPVLWATLPGYLIAALLFFLLGPAPTFPEEAPAKAAATPAAEPPIASKGSAPESA